MGSKRGALYTHGETPSGYEDHPRMIPISSTGTFEKGYHLDVIFHNPSTLKSQWWLAHIGEYDENLHLLPVGPCVSPEKQLFASDHAALFVEYTIL